MTKSKTKKGESGNRLALPTKKICILGTTPSRSSAPFEDKSWEFWTIGPGGSEIPNWDRLFELHRADTWPEGFKDYLDLLKATQPPKIVYTMAPQPDWPANVVYPRDQIFKRYKRRMWFSSQISYAIALALEENVTDLGVYGIDLESGEEYVSQFVGAAHLIDVALLAGVNIHMPVGCGLMRDVNPYPDSYETHVALMTEAKIKLLSQIANNGRVEHESLLADIHRHEGAVTALRAIKDAPPEVLAEAQRLEDEQGRQSVHLGQLSAQINRADGELGAFQFVRQLYATNGTDPG